MKASKFTEAQKAFILKQGEQGTPVAEICRKAGISQATYFNWKKRYGGLLPDEMRRLKQLERHLGQARGELRRFIAHQFYHPRPFVTHGAEPLHEFFLKFFICRYRAYEDPVMVVTIN